MTPKKVGESFAACAGAAKAATVAAVAAIVAKARTSVTTALDARSCADFAQNAIGVDARERFTQPVFCLVERDPTTDQLERHEPRALGAALRRIAAYGRFGKRRWCQLRNGVRVHLDHAEAHLPKLFLQLGCLRTDRRRELLQRTLYGVDPRQRFTSALTWVN